MSNQDHHLPLTARPEGSAAATIRIRCSVTGIVLPWNAAAKAGWVSDLKGEPFKDYLCPAACGSFKTLGEQENTEHPYALEVESANKTKNGRVEVFANNRNQAARIAENAGWVVGSVNMIG